MKKVKWIISFVLGVSMSSFALQTHSVVGTVDTRDYVLTVSSSFGEPWPSTGTQTQSWHSLVYSSVLESPVFDLGGTALRLCSGFSGTGISPSSGSAQNITVKLTNVISTLTWNWNSSYWVTWSIVGSGDLQSTYPASGGWYNEEQSYSLKTRPESGWLFTGWSGGASGGPSATNLNFTATAPTNLMATFSDDADSDGLLNSNETAIGSSPWKKDTDDDGFDDKLEVDNGGSPIVSDAWRTDYIRANGDDFNLYSSNVVLDVAMGEILLETVGSDAILSLQLETSEDLTIWSNAGPAKVWSWPVDDEKKFFRVKSAK